MEERLGWGDLSKETNQKAISGDDLGGWMSGKKGAYTDVVKVDWLCGMSAHEELRMPPRL